MQEFFKPQINTFTDKANFVLYDVANVALCVAVEYVTQTPILTAAAFVASSTVLYLSSLGFNDILKRNFPPTPDIELPPGLKEIPDITAKLSEKIGLHPPPPIHVIRRGAKATEEFARNKHELRLVDAFNKYANAMTYGTKESGLIVSEKTMRTQDSSEKAFVLAHELGHQAAHHLRNSNALSLLTNTATYSAFGYNLITVFSSWTGWIAPALGIAVVLKSGPLVQALMPESIYEKYDRIIPNTRYALGFGTIIGCSYLTGDTRILGSWCFGQAVNVAAKLLFMGYSRCNEYQADRIAAEATGDVKSASTSLMKIHAAGGEFSSKFLENIPSQKSGMQRLFDKAREAFRTHPTIDKRLDNIQKVALGLKSSSASPV